MSTSLIIVESPAKARTLHKFLGQQFVVKSSKGHVKDLPVKQLGVDVEHAFKPTYVLIAAKRSVVAEIKKAAKDADVVYLAPDPDREGEAIAWHIASELKNGEKIYRITFHEITHDAVRRALEHPGRIDTHLVDAYQARRVLDRLVGYQISPLLWRRVKRGLSAGRVQSVALRLICDREREIQKFTRQEYWSIIAHLEGAAPPDFTALLVAVERKKPDIRTEDEAKRLVASLRSATFSVASIERKDRARNPLPPFITSTLEQTAASVLGFTIKKTMRVAQQLYEGLPIGDRGLVGLITYMRTDSTRVAREAIARVRAFVSETFGEAYLPAKPRTYASAKMAQEAHEAIRPTMVDLTPEQTAPHLERDQQRLYDLIWRRFVASQMKPAVYDTVQVDIAANECTFRATSSVLTFDGWLRLMPDAMKVEPKKKKPKGDEAEADESANVNLPDLSVGERVRLLDLEPKQHFTKPPPRFTEGSLVRELERLGIGRPSTYAMILSKIQDRNYTQKVRRRFVPTELGLLVTDLLVANFPNILSVEFTAEMESRLDEIEGGKLDWVRAIRDFYEPFTASLNQAKEGMRVEAEPTGIVCERCGSPMVKRWGKNGFFLACSAYPECTNTRSISTDASGKIIEHRLDTEHTCEKCGGQMVLRTGRYGPFLACSNYPKCRNIKRVVRTSEGTIEVHEPKTLDEKCPKCGSALLERIGRYGPFTACSAYPKCRYIKKKRRHSEGSAVPCPRQGCDGHLARRRTRRGKTFFSCSNYPECDFATWTLKDLEETSSTPTPSSEPADGRAAR